MESSEGSITLILQYVISNIESNQASTINLVEMSKNRMMRGQVKAANKDWKRTFNRAGTRKDQLYARQDLRQCDDDARAHGCTDERTNTRATEEKEKQHDCR